MIQSLIKRTWQRVWRLYSIRKNVNLGAHVHLGLWSRVDAPNGFRIGDNSYIGKFCTIECDGSIGRYVMLANNVGLIGRYDHDFTCVGKPIRLAPWIGDKGYSGLGKDLEIVIEDDVWIGFGAIILSGTHIGRGAIVGAGSVVTNDVAPYAIVIGNPAHFTGWRFTSEEIAEHERALATREF